MSRTTASTDIFQAIADPVEKTCTKRATLLRLIVLGSTDTRGVPQIKQFIRNNFRYLRKILLDLGRVARFV